MQTKGVLLSATCPKHMLNKRKTTYSAVKIEQFLNFANHHMQFLYGGSRSECLVVNDKFCARKTVLRFGFSTRRRPPLSKNVLPNVRATVRPRALLSLDLVADL